MSDDEGGWEFPGRKGPEAERSDANDDTRGKEEPTRREPKKTNGVGRGKEAMKIDRHNESKGGLDGRENDRGYVAPQIQTFTAEEFMNVLGPAQGYGGGGGTEENPVGRGFRLFPGLR
jgi:hypothetical protein